MKHTEDGERAGSFTVDSLRQIVIGVAEELAATGAGDAAEALLAAATTLSFPAAELLAMREALVETRRHWDRPGMQNRRVAVEAMNEAKALAIRL